MIPATLITYLLFITIHNIVVFEILRVVLNDYFLDGVCSKRQTQNILRTVCFGIIASPRSPVKTRFIAKIYYYLIHIYICTQKYI